MKFAYADQLAAGLAEEHIVCADLLAMGYSPFRTEQAAPYDVAVDVGGGHILRLQVKATREPKPYPQLRQRHVTGYTWAMRHGKRGLRGYAEGAVDGFALVALDVRLVVYLPPGRQIFQMPTSGAKRASKTFDDYSFDSLLASAGGRS